MSVLDGCGYQEGNDADLSLHFFFLSRSTFLYNVDLLRSRCRQVPIRNLHVTSADVRSDRVTHLTVDATCHEDIGSSRIEMEA